MLAVRSFIAKFLSDFSHNIPILCNYHVSNMDTIWGLSTVYRVIILRHACF